MHQPIQFKASLLAAAISMLVAGPALATPDPTPAVGNTLVGPDLKSVGATTVKINQSGTGNITSSTGTAEGAAFVLDQSNGPVSSTTTTLTIQQVGTGNRLGLRSYTLADTKIQVFQGVDAEAGNTGRLGTDATKTVESNSAMIQIGESAAQRAGATDVFLTQQGNSNIASLFLGRATGAFTGTLNLLQIGADNFAEAAINGQTTVGQTFNIGQRGDSNGLSLTANGNQSTGMTLDFGGLSFGQSTAQPGALDGEGNNNARTYRYAGGDVALNALFGTSLTGIHLLGTDVFKIQALDGYNKVQVDLAGAAATGNKIDVRLESSYLNFAVFGEGGAAINLGGSGRLDSTSDLVVYANGGSVSMNNVRLEGNTYLSTADGGSITLRGGEGRGSVLQSGAAHSFSSINNSNASVSLNVTQTGLVANTLAVTHDGDSGGGSYTLTQTSQTGGGGHAMTLVNEGERSSSWTVTQSGAGAKTLAMTSSTKTAVINASQTGDASQSATGISFAAAASSSFTLVQR